MERKIELEKLAELRQRLGLFSKRLIPIGKNEILDEAYTESFINFLNELTLLVSNDFSYPNEALTIIRNAAQKLTGGLRIPDLKTIVELDGAMNALSYQIRSNDSKYATELFFSDDNIDALLAKKGVMTHILRKFHNTASQLQKRYKSRCTISIDDEYDVQDLLYSFLKSIFKDVEKEKATGTFSGRSSRLDIAINDISTVIEVKMTRDTLKKGDLSEQMSADKDQYRNSTHYRDLIFFIYDPGHYIDNHASIKQHETRDDKQNVSVIISPGQ